jgi:DNA-directed RNA polymerase specialized sigma24 family protein
MAHAFTDRVRIERVLAGDRDAFVALYDRELPVLWRHATERSAGRGAAEALVSATLAHAFRHLREYPPSLPFTEWLQAIAEQVAARPPAAQPDEASDALGR